MVACHKGDRQSIVVILGTAYPHAEKYNVPCATEDTKDYVGGEFCWIACATRAGSEAKLDIEQGCFLFKGAYQYFLFRRAPVIYCHLDTATNLDDLQERLAADNQPQKIDSCYQNTADIQFLDVEKGVTINDEVLPTSSFLDSLVLDPKMIDAFSLF